MSDDLDLAWFEEALLELQEQVLGITDLVENSAKTVELDQNRMGRLSRMDALQGQALAQASADRQQQQLTDIEQALDRIEQGEYGRCLECDQGIAPARLRIDLTAAYCISCAQALEK